MRARILSVIRVTPSAGKSAVATNVAGELSRFSRVVLIDCHTRDGSASAWAGQRQDEMYSARLDVHTASTPAALLERVHGVRSTGAYVILDGPPDAGMTAAMIAVADLCLIPVSAGEDDAIGPRATIDVFRNAPTMRRPRVRIVRNRCPGSAMPTREEERWKEVGPKTLRNGLGLRPAYVEAMASGRTAGEIRDPVARDQVQALVMEIKLLLPPGTTGSEQFDHWPASTILGPRSLLHLTG
ncbi:MAG: ParA family protein [Casimicrobiaceae bacterium]